MFTSSTKDNGKELWYKLILYSSKIYSYYNFWMAVHFILSH